MLARKARPGDVYELVPSKALQRGLDDGVLRVAKSARGDASVLVKDATTGRIAGHQDLRQVKPKPASLLGPAVWQAMAMATQQHYLVEISSKLDGIQKGVDEVLARMDDDRIGQLNHVSEKAAACKATLARSGRLSAGRADELRRDADEVKLLWHKVATTTRRHIEQYHQGTCSAETVEQDLTLAVHVLRTLTQCSETLLALPYATSDELADVLEQEEDRLRPAVAEHSGLVVELTKASNHWARERAAYRRETPRGLLKRGWNTVGPVGRFGPPEPEQGPFVNDTLWRLRSVLKADSRPMPTLVVEVQADGSVLLAPAA
jgi:hypothetical protein